MIWQQSEIFEFLDCIDEEEWDRGQLGEDVYMLLHEDPDISTKIEKVACNAILARNERVAFAAFHLAIYWAGEEGLEKFVAMIDKCPALRKLPFTDELENTLHEYGHVSIF